MPNRYSEALILQARQARESAIRASARSMELIARALVVRQSVMSGLHKIAEARAARIRMLAGPAAPSRLSRWVDTIVPLPLTAPMLREIADEFRQLADRAPSPEVTVAFHGLALRYTALAAGYDSEAIGSRRLH